MNVLSDPAILFFVLGIAAGLLRSNLEVPAALSKFLALYLLMAIGLKGGFALSQTGITPTVAAALGCAMLLATVIPLLDWQFLKRVLNPHDALAVACTYGSVSAVTFVTAAHILESQGNAGGGYMAAAMALMESPAILLALAGAHWIRTSKVTASATVAAMNLSGGQSQYSVALRGALTEGGTILLLGALLVGAISGPAGAKAMQPFTGDLFKGMLAFFLLDMGLSTARQLSSLRKLPVAMFVYAVGAPVVHAVLALILARLCSLSPEDGTLLAVLAASASYIAVPAVLRRSMPEANSAVYVGLSLGVTFPFNLLAGISLYQEMAKWALV